MGGLEVGRGGQAKERHARAYTHSSSECSEQPNQAAMQPQHKALLCFQGFFICVCY